jgi:hypothetical protein
MKPLSIFSLLFLIVVCQSCDKDNIAANTPACIRQEIKNNEKTWGVGSVDEYLFQNRVVYAFSPDEKVIADGTTEIKDEFCNSLCIIGGFGGPNINMCNGDNFYQTAVLKRNIWKK